MGTPHYMAPEQIEHPQDVDHRADIYSLGVVFYQMLTGELPHRAASPRPRRKVQIDVRLDEVVLRALEKEPELRYQQASEVKTEVENISSGQPPYGERSSVHPVLRAFGRHMRSRWMTPVRTRNGKPTIHWPSAIFITLAIACPIYAFYQFSDWVESLFGKRRHDDPVEGLVEMLISVAITAIGMFFCYPLEDQKLVKEIHDGQLIGRAKAEAAKAATANPLPVIQGLRRLWRTEILSRAWEKTSAYFQQDVGKDEWVAFMEKVRRPLGKSTRCELLSTNWLNVGIRSETRYERLLRMIQPQRKQSSLRAKPMVNGGWKAIGSIQSSRMRDNLLSLMRAASPRPGHRALSGGNPRSGCDSGHRLRDACVASVQNTAPAVGYASPGAVRRTCLRLRGGQFRDLCRPANETTRILSLRRRRLLPGHTRHAGQSAWPGRRHMGTCRPEPGGGFGSGV